MDDPVVGRSGRSDWAGSTTISESRSASYRPVVKTRLTGVGTSVMLPVGVSFPVF
jgi:hypothetical protein